MDRRQFLHLLARTGSAASLASLHGIRCASAATPGKVLVVVFLRGGWDGLSVTVPFGDDDYYRLRPTLAMQPPGHTEGALNLDGFFGLHPSMPELHRLYLNGSVAIMPTVLHDAGTLSHFAAQDIIETARAPGTTTGWLAQLLMENGLSAKDHAMSFGTRPPLSMAGTPFPAPNFVHLSDIDLATAWKDRQVLGQVMESAYAGPINGNNPNAAMLHQIGAYLPSEIEALKGIGEASLSSRSMYPETLFGTQMRHAAALIRARSNLNLLTVDFSGWDTHRMQGSHDGHLSALLAQFSAAVSGFFDDLGSLASNVLVLAATEFGRTAAENASAGTDHGHASTWLVMGPSVRGGIYLGDRGWPGLAEDNLADGRALAHTTDFRSIYSEIAGKFLGTANLAGLFPGFLDSELGFLA